MAHASSSRPKARNPIRQKVKDIVIPCVSTRRLVLVVHNLRRLQCFGSNWLWEEHGTPNPTWNSPYRSRIVFVVR
jgi:hypothetical protein